MIEDISRLSGMSVEDLEQILKQHPRVLTAMAGRVRPEALRAWAEGLGWEQFKNLVSVDGAECWRKGDFVAKIPLHSDWKDYAEAVVRAVRRVCDEAELDVYGALKKLVEAK